jgi:hypothetical protein
VQQQQQQIQLHLQQQQQLQAQALQQVSASSSLLSLQVLEGPLSLRLTDTRVYAPYIRARLGNRITPILGVCRKSLLTLEPFDIQAAAAPGTGAPAGQRAFLSPCSSTALACEKKSATQAQPVPPLKYLFFHAHKPTTGPPRYRTGEHLSDVSLGTKLNTSCCRIGRIIRFRNLCQELTLRLLKVDFEMFERCSAVSPCGIQGYPAP